MANLFYYPFSSNQTQFKSKLVRDVEATDLGVFKHVTLNQPQIFQRKNDLK